MGLFDRFKRKKPNKDYTKEIIAHLGCDCDLFEVNDIKSVMNKYFESLIQGKKEGYTPLIVIPSEEMLEVFTIEEYTNADRKAVLEKAKDIDVKNLLETRLADVMPMEDDDVEDIAGEFSAADPTNYFLSLEEQVNKNAIIAKIPTVRPWEVAAWVPMGGFTECPFSEEQVSVFKYWYEKYRAVPALVTHNEWELFVENPPTTQEESELLAWEHFGFCGDIVWQGAGRVNALAGTLINSSVWYFWWD